MGETTRQQITTTAEARTRRSPTFQTVAGNWVVEFWVRGAAWAKARGRRETQRHIYDGSLVKVRNCSRFVQLANEFI